MQQESKTQCTNNDVPRVIIEGIDKVIKLDLSKHQELLEQAKLSALSYRESVSHLVKRKKHYSALLKAGQYNKEAMEKSIEMIGVDVRALSDKVKLANESIEHETLIVDTLSEQLDDYYKNNAA